MTRKGARQKWIAYSRTRIVLYRGINLMVALYNTFLGGNFLSLLLISKPHTKSTSDIDYIIIV